MLDDKKQPLADIGRRDMAWHRAAMLPLKGRSRWRQGLAKAARRLQRAQQVVGNKPKEIGRNVTDDETN